MPVGVEALGMSRETDSTAVTTTNSPLTLERTTDIDPPAQWAVVSDAELGFDTRAAWRHRETGLEVRVRRDRRPTQMHTPETSRDDTGFVCEVETNNSTGEGPVLEHLTHRLAGKRACFERALEFMTTIDDGEFEPAHDPWRGGPRPKSEW